MSYKVYITTVDNPYDPSKDFRNWFMFDETHGYHTCQLLDRVSITSNSLSDRTNMSAIERAIDEIIKFNGSELYKKIIVNDNESDFIPKNESLSEIYEKE